MSGKTHFCLHFGSWFPLEQQFWNVVLSDTMVPSSGMCYSWWEFGGHLTFILLSVVCLSIPPCWLPLVRMALYRWFGGIFVMMYLGSLSSYFWCLGISCTCALIVFTKFGDISTVISSNISVLTYFLFGDSKAMSRERGHVPLCSLVSCSASLHASCVLLSGCFAYGCPSYNSIMLSMIQTLYLKTTNATGLSGETSYWLRMHTVLL